MGDFGTEVVDALYRFLQIDDAWAVRRDRGFTWWAHSLAQHVEVGEPHQAKGIVMCTLRVWTDVVTDVDPATDPGRVVGMANLNQTVNAFVWDRPTATIKEFCTMPIYHVNAAESSATMIGIPAILQNTSAHGLVEAMAQQCGGTPSVSEHPVNGLRGDWDDVFRFPADVIIPMGGHPSVFASQEPFGQHSSEGSMMSGLGDFAHQNLWVGSGDDTSFLCEVPFTGPGLVLGHTALVQIFTNQPHPRFGNGALTVMQLPVSPGPDRSFMLANALNAQESAEGPPGLGLMGAWCPDFMVDDHNGLAFVTFAPNAIAAPALLENLIQYAAIRARFAADVLASFPATTHLL